jgi:hypothetical protein
MSRSVPSASLIVDQIDLYDPPGGIIRAVGVLAADVTVSVFSNNSFMSWPLIDGTMVPDSSISSGTIYFNEIVGQPGFYSVRFFPSRIGFWRLIFSIPSITAEVIREFDVFSQSSGPANGLNASFTI